MIKPWSCTETLTLPGTSTWTTAEETELKAPDFVPTALVDTQDVMKYWCSGQWNDGIQPRPDVGLGVMNQQIFILDFKFNKPRESEKKKEERKKAAETETEMESVTAGTSHDVSLAPTQDHRQGVGEEERKKAEETETEMESVTAGTSYDVSQAPTQDEEMDDETINKLLKD